ncbi:uncharacterized protein PAC_09375 [Phialocephala subalpina]|uniref:Uncharacterized protein n=1 Tax=Phialocephala subalpina TaxID=576137 RepID=A0A1L7X372_9HELO|nr:uncharacterized protein PAC_09375 [Phialocephala subalpina]
MATSSSSSPLTALAPHRTAFNTGRDPRPSASFFTTTYFFELVLETCSSSNLFLCPDLVILNMATTANPNEAPLGNAYPIKDQKVPERGYLFNFGDFQAIGYTMSMDDVGSGHYVSFTAVNVCNLHWERKQLGSQRLVMALAINGQRLPDGTFMASHPLLSSKDAAVAEFYKLEAAAGLLEAEIKAKYAEYSNERSRQGFAVLPLPTFGMDTVTCPRHASFEKQFDVFRAARLMSADVVEGGEGYYEVYNALESSGRPPVIGKWNTYDISGTMEARVIARKAHGQWWLTTYFEQAVLQVQGRMQEKVIIENELINPKAKAYDFTSLPDTTEDKCVYYTGLIDCQTSDVPTWLPGTEKKTPAQQWSCAVKAADDRICKYLKFGLKWEAHAAREYTNSLTRRGFTRNIAIDKILEVYLEGLAKEEKSATKAKKSKKA